MIYMMADNNLEAPGIDNITELIGIGSTENVNIIVQVDWAEGLAKESPWRTDDLTGHERWYIHAGHHEVLATLDEPGANTGSLVSFLEWGMTQYPAEKYSVVIWNHGGGWFFGEDLTPEGQFYMSLTEIEAGIQGGLEAAGVEKIDLLIFYACLMASYETIIHLSPYADYLLASEEVTYGFKFEALQDLVNDPTMGPVTLGQKFIDPYLDLWTEYEAKLTISLIDLAQSANLKSAVSAFGNLANSLIDSELVNLAAARNQTAPFNLSNTCTAGTLVDLAHFVDNVHEITADTSLKTAAENVRTTIDSAVLGQSNGSLQPNANGIAIYFPEESCFNTHYNSLIGIEGSQTFLGAYYGTPFSDIVPPTFTGHSFSATSENFVWSGTLDPDTTLDLKELRFSYASYINPNNLEGGFISGLGSQLIESPDPNSFTHTYDLTRAYAFSTTGCFLGSCDWVYIYNRTAGTPNDSFNMPIWHVDTDDNGSHVDWRATFNTTTQTTVGNEFYIQSSEGLVSGLEPSSGDVFRTLATYKPAVAPLSEGFSWYFYDNAILDATAFMTIGFQSIETEEILVYSIGAKDLAGNQQTIRACSGPPNQYFLLIYAYDATPGWDGGDAIEDLPDFSVQLILDGAIIRDTPAVENEGSMLAMLTIPYTSGTLELKIHDEDGETEEQLTYWDALHTLLEYVDINQSGATGYVDGNAERSASIYIQAIRCAEH